jgi:hypothetical protein
MARIIFVIDATSSRQRTQLSRWDLAKNHQSTMFAAAKGLEMQLCYFNGPKFSGFQWSPWYKTAADMSSYMHSHIPTCDVGGTQIECALIHLSREAKLVVPKAVVYIGDCTEEDPDQIDLLLRQHSHDIPWFVCHELIHKRAYPAKLQFRRIADMTQGDYFQFGPNSHQDLEQWLSAVAGFAAGQHKSVKDMRLYIAKG